VILSLEMHCKKPQQNKVAFILSKIIGLENIWTLPDDVESISDENGLPHFPSPEKL
jgi:hypothetical protein